MKTKEKTVLRKIEHRLKFLLRKKSRYPYGLIKKHMSENDVKTVLLIQEIKILKKLIE